MIAIADLTADAWTVGATRYSGPQYDRWEWHVAEPSVLRMAVAGGAVITAHRRGDDGVTRLVARRPKHTNTRRTA